MDNTTPPELILGKYKDVDALKNGYISLKNAHDELATNRNSFTVPTDGYVINDNYSLADPAVIEKTRDSATKIGMTQKQFESSLQQNIESHKQKDKDKTDITKHFGEELDTLKNYVVKDLRMSESIFNKMNKSELESIREIRSNSLNTGSTDISSSSIMPSSYTAKDRQNAFQDYMAAKRSGDYQKETFHRNNYRKIVAKMVG